ncbi:hypothetical protein BABINDRAFT_163844 [Babjeviella inositovora NRRL Y-12698]|uniref:RNA helicase n=1 Tax=Babjeviella inositovora NRRL Y-12698 TaxID=984486 RepID=A0A1E3QI49_9ASCO|nr:uncharacterized protein BABINDRAFT_163844 [Babjeviella inositovora NRRL Y-12698]ODQ77114.1 hypothetical protein BABINDRAFT_163844 [Babjeviella inositovora NRRL Y-12698]
MATRSKIPNTLLGKRINSKNRAVKAKRASKPKAPKMPRERKEAQIVGAQELNWKEVEIPDNLEDFGGFYGLEEIDGVGVKIVNGNIQFSTSDEKNIITEETEEAEMEAEGTDREQNAEDAEDQDVETADINEENELTETLEVEETESAEQPKKAKEKKTKKKPETKLLTNAFNSLTEIELPNDEDINLPDWENAEKGLSLSPYTLHGLSQLGFKKPTPIQKSSLPLAMQGRDVIGKASTGSGKTLAYGIPILERYLTNTKLYKKGEVRPPTGIIFAPTRELAHQVVEHLNEIAKYSPLGQHGIVGVTGGLSIQKQERLLSHGPGIIVATPGRLLELLQKNATLLSRLSSTDVVVLDEADRLLQDGHFDEFEKILDLFGKSRLKDQNLSYRWQTLVFSATFSSDLFGKLDKHRKAKNNHAGSLVNNDEILKMLTEKLKFKDPKPALIDANPTEFVSDLVTEALIECGATERDLYLYYFLLMYPGTTLVFANSIDSVKRIVPFLNNLDIPAFAIHSSMIQKARMRSIERFKEASSQGKSAILVASDVAARGLDIPNITHVVQYHLPRSADTYVHRSGRTARAGKEGVSVMICSPAEASGPLKRLRNIVANKKKGVVRINAKDDIKLLPIETDILAQCLPRSQLAAELADSEVCGNSTRKDDNWMKQAAEDLGIDDISDLDEDEIIRKQRKRKEFKTLDKADTKSTRAKLRHLMKALIRKDGRRNYLTGGLTNLAHHIVNGNGHSTIIGHAKTNALVDLRSGKSKNAKDEKARRAAEKQTERKTERIADKKAKKNAKRKKV